MEDLDNVSRFVDAVVNQDRGMYDLVYAGPSVHGAANVWEIPQQVNVVEDCVAKPLGGCWKVSPRVGQDFLEVR